MGNIGKKNSILKNIMAALVCAVCAGAAVAGASWAVGSHLDVDSQVYSQSKGPSWLDRVEVRVGGSPVSDIGDKITGWPEDGSEDVNNNNTLTGNGTKKKVPDEERAFLGISGTDVAAGAAGRYGMPAGVYVTNVVGGTAADKAGIAKGDIVTYMDDEQLTGMDQLMGLLEAYAAGTDAGLVVMRQCDGGYRQQTITVTLGARE